MRLVPLQKHLVVWVRPIAKLGEKRRVAREPSACTGMNPLVSGNRKIDGNAGLSLDRLARLNRIGPERHLVRRSDLGALGAKTKTL